MSSVTQVNTVDADGLKVFYRHAGPADAPVILLLHGFPTSSHMFRNLIPLLAKKYRVVAPDIPGFGFTVVPAEREYKYTFANFATTIGKFLDALAIKKFAVYLFDYGAPTGLRLALERPDAITAIFAQNGNAYDEGLGKDFWAPIQKYWISGAQEDRDAIRFLFTADITKYQYSFGFPHPELVQPETYYLDQALLERPGIKEIQLDIFYDYRTNLDLYPQFQEYFRTSGVPVLAVWGRQDPIFVAPGADAYVKDAQVFERHWIDAGHFALETNEDKVAHLILAFLEKNKIF